MAAAQTDLFSSARVDAIPRSGIRSVLEGRLPPGAVSLAAGDPDFATPAHIVAAALEAMRQGETHYTHGRGLIELREAFAEKLLLENQIGGVDPGSNVVVTAGALNALAATFLAIVDAGDRVIIPDPGFANYEAQVLLAGGQPVPLRAGNETAFLPDLDQLESLAADAKVLVINTPGNPTGAVLDRDVLIAVAEIAERHDLIVIADEAYEHLVFGASEHVSFASLPGMFERTITVHSMSKSWAMTGWRVGFASGPEAVMASITKVQEHLIGCPPAMTQWGALAALTGSHKPRTTMIEHYARRRQRVLDALADAPLLDCVTPNGAFYAFPRFDVGASGYELASLVAEEAGVIMVPGIAFGAQGSRHLRISYALPDDELAEGLGKLTRWLHRRAEKPSAAEHGEDNHDL